MTVVGSCSPKKLKKKKKNKPFITRRHRPSLDLFSLLFCAKMLREQTQNESTAMQLPRCGTHSNLTVKISLILSIESIHITCKL